MEPYRGFDLLGIDDLLTEEERGIRDTVRDFVENEVLPVVTTHFNEGTFPMELFPRMAEMGLMGAHIKGYGCAGVSSVAYGLIMQELERGDSGLRSSLSVQSSLVMSALDMHGSEEQKQRYLPEMAAGRIMGSFGLTETGHGSDPGGMETTAEKVSGGYRIKGSKFWITHAPIANAFIIWAKTPEGIRAFLVERERQGLSTYEVKNKLSMRMSITGAVNLDNVEVPEENMLPGSTRGLGAALQCLNFARLGIVWGTMGAASACLHEALEYAKGRVQFSRPIAAYQLVQGKLADMVTDISHGQLISYHLSKRKDEGKLHHTQTSMAKYTNAQNALDIARTCRDLMGAAGILDDFCVMRHLMNLETVNTYEGTRHVHQLVLGRHLTGISAFDG